MMSIVRTAELRCAIGRSRRPQRSFLVKECRSTRLPLLVLHICAGILGLLSGAVDVVAQGFPSASGGWKRIVISMLSLAASAAYPALMKSQVTNVLGGGLTILFGDNGHGWGRSHARARRCFWRTTHRAASLVHVLCAVFSPQAPFSWDSNKYSPALPCSGAVFAVAVRGLQSWPCPRRRKWFFAIHMRRAPLLNRQF